MDIRVLPMSRQNHLAFTTLLVAALFRVVPATAADVAPTRVESPPDKAAIAKRLETAYPGLVIGIEGNDVVFKDRSRLPFDDGKKAKPFAEWLVHPDIEDMFREPYPKGAPITPPPADFDPGRARNAGFFAKIYGNCRDAGFAKSLTTIAWLPRKTKQRLTVTTINGVADKLKAVSDELDALPSNYDVFLVPSAGTYVCRPIAGTDQRSAHGYGIAIDIALKRSDYWRWAKGGPAGAPQYKNEIPPEIVRIFEKHGFIWGGRWFHYDTMHFEYRPELLD